MEKRREEPASPLSSFEIKSFDRWLLGALAAVMIVAAVGHFVAYAKQTRFDLCRADPSVAERGRGESSVLYLPAREFERLRSLENPASTLFSPTAGGRAFAAELEAGEAEIGLRVAGIAGIPRGKVPTVVVRSLPERTRCSQQVSSLELRWPRRSLLAWMIPSLRGLGE